jgi:hypothetical protein
MAKKGGKVREGHEILEEDVEEFVAEQMERYIRLHKEHEKDLRYIG